MLAASTFFISHFSEKAKEFFFLCKTGTYSNISSTNRLPQITVRLHSFLGCVQDSFWLVTDLILRKAGECVISLRSIIEKASIPR